MSRSLKEVSNNLNKALTSVEYGQHIVQTLSHLEKLQSSLKKATSSNRRGKTRRSFLRSSQRAVDSANLGEDQNKIYNKLLAAKRNELKAISEEKRRSQKKGKKNSKIKRGKNSRHFRGRG